MPSTLFDAPSAQASRIGAASRDAQSRHPAAQATSFVALRIQLDRRVAARPGAADELLEPVGWHGAAALTVFDADGRPQPLVLGVRKLGAHEWSCAVLSATGTALAAPLRWRFEPDTGHALGGASHCRLTLPGAGAATTVALACHRLREADGPFTVVEVRQDGHPDDDAAQRRAAPHASDSAPGVG